MHETWNINQIVYICHSKLPILLTFKLYIKVLYNLQFCLLHYIKLKTIKITQNKLALND